MDGFYQQLKKFGDVRANEPMNKHTSFKIGGPARFFVAVSETEKLVELLRFLDGAGERYVILGGGSNTLVRDEGYDGIVIRMQNIEYRMQNDTVEASSGCLTATIAREATMAGLAGFEWAVGVPGTIGGATRGNAGASGGEMKDVVREVDAYSGGEVVTYTNDQCEFAYRHSQFKTSGEVILRVRLRLSPGDPKEGMKKLLAVLTYRTDTQPKGNASIGCIFKNFQFSIFNFQKLSEKNVPKEFLEKKRIPAGWLVEKAGMKGAKEGGAMVSAVHGNFILNTGNATAQDVLTLIERIKERVYDTSGVEIGEEIQVV